MTEDVGFDLFVDSEVLDEAAQGFLLTIPEDAAKSGNPLRPGGKASWGQDLTIEYSKVAPDEKDAGVLVFEVGFQVPASSIRSNGNPDPNAGRSFKQWYRITRAAVSSPSHDKFKATKFNLGQLKKLLGALGISDLSGNVNLGSYFGGSTPPIVGMNLSVVMKRSWYEGKAKDEISDFISPEAASL